MTGLSHELLPAPWLARVDPMLAVLPRALPPAATEPHLHDACWDPGQRCRLAYRLASSPSSSFAFLAVELMPDGWRRHGYRHDPGLPGLAAASDPVRAAAWLEQSTGHAIHGCRVEPVRYRPGERCVLRYDVGTGASVTTMYAKVVRPDLFAPQCRVATGLASSPVRGHVPEVVGVWADAQALVTRAVPGRTLGHALADVDLSAAERDACAFALGGLLASFHAQPDVATARWTRQDQMDQLEHLLPAAQLVDPDLGSRLRQILGDLRGLVTDAEPEVLCHGSVRPGQVMVTPEGALVMVDLDGACRCGAARDLGNVLAHLTWQCLLQPENASAITAAERALLCGYQCRAGPVDAQALRWWRAAAVVQVAARRYRRLESTHWPLVHWLADSAEGAVEGMHRTGDVPRPADPMSAPQMSEVLHEQVPLLTDDHGGLEVHAATALPSAPGRRRVIGYEIDVTGDGAGDRGHHVTVFGKVFTEPRRARLLYDHMCLLHYGPFHDGALRVPEPVALLPEQRMVLYRGCDGVPLDRLPPQLLTDGITGAARWLARLHSCGVHLPRRLSLDDEVRTCRTWAAVIGRVCPDLADRADRLADAWEESVRSIDTDTWVPIHKDFHPAHVLVGTGICVVDLDEAREGDAAFDVAHFCEYLQLVDSDRMDTTGLLDLFMREYAETTGWLDHGAYAVFRGYTSLKIARQWATASGPCRGASPTQRLNGTDRALAEAERWLAA